MISRPIYQGSDWWKFSIRNGWWLANQSASISGNIVGNSAGNPVGNAAGNSVSNSRGNSVENATGNPMGNSVGPIKCTS